MSAQILTLLKYGLLALLYLYFARVMHTVWVELRPTGKLEATDKTRKKRGSAGRSRSSHQGSHSAPAPVKVPAEAAAAGAAAGAAHSKGSTGEHRHRGKPSHKHSKPASKQGSNGSASGTASSLAVVEPKNLAGMTYPISSRELTIGRAPGCGITVDDSYVSSLHARLAESNNQTILEDLGSRNGTWVNEKRITDPTVVKPGDRIRVGSVIMELR